MTSLPFNNYINPDGQNSNIFQSLNIQSFFVVLHNMNFNHCPFLSALYGRTRVVPENHCEDVVLRPSLPGAGLQEFAGKCHKFKMALASNTQYIFKVYFSQISNFEQYLNNFKVLSYMEGLNNKSFDRSAFDLKITDEFFKAFSELKPLTYNFGSDQLPFEWRSYGQFVTIFVKIHDVIREKSFLTISVMADFERSTVMTYMTIRYIKDIHNCDSTPSQYATRFGCMSVHTNFTGSWNMANDICQQKGGYLWSVNDYQEWEEILHSPRITYIGRDGAKPINVAKYFRTSSVLFLGYQAQVKISDDRMSCYISSLIQYC